MIRSPIRVLAFFTKWLAEVIREPALMLSLVVGPFLVLLAFGEGVEIGGPKPRTVIVRDNPSGQGFDPLPADLLTHVELVGETTDMDAALAAMRRTEADAVLVVPQNPAEHIDAGEQIPITVILGDIDPVRRSYARAYLRDQVAELNQQTIQRAVAGAMEGSFVPNVSLGRVQATDVPPGVLAQPFVLDLQEGLIFVPDFTEFYAPAILALLLQHLGITLGALSMARLRLLRLTELLRVAPVRTSEVVTGHYLSYGALTLIAGALLLAGLLLLLGVPVFGPWLVLVAVMVLLALTSLGIGLVISLLSSSEQQATQLAMLILLTSIFFSGFAFSLDRITWPIRAISFALPVTYAIRTLQDVMLRGLFLQPLDVAVLAGASVFFFLATVVLMRREFRAG